MEKGKKLTLEALLAKKEQREAERFAVRRVEVPSLGGTLDLERIPLTRIAAMMDGIGGDSMVDSLAFDAELIYACCPMMRNRELQAAYECAEPTDIVFRLLGDNMGEVNLMGSEILKMYGLDSGADLKTLVKN